MRTTTTIARRALLPIGLCAAILGLTLPAAASQTMPAWDGPALKTRGGTGSTIVSPRDTASGQATGRRTIISPRDSASGLPTGRRTIISPRDPASGLPGR